MSGELSGLSVEFNFVTSKTVLFNKSEREGLLVSLENFAISPK
jgi:hypothetical protein